ncbi:MAG: trypsin-like peptidase domain-containing protein [Acidobacteria bacterium]|nr:trypsin-like peptidase domain-containing protein [Acidobacteriota bacterium]
MRQKIIKGRPRTSMAGAEMTKPAISYLNLTGRLTLLLLLGLGSGAGTYANAQELRDLFRQVKSSVVTVRTIKREITSQSKNEVVIVPGVGAGVLISAEGKVMTAAHVVHAVDRVIVEFTEGREIPAQVIASVITADVALLKLDWVPTDAVVARLGDSDQAEVGDQVFVIGAPYGLNRTLTVGHLSARYTHKNLVGGLRAVEMLQTDAAVNKGNSGGPMFNMKGEVIGIVSNLISRSGGFEGLGFAVTSNLARRLLLEQTTYWSGLEGIIIAGKIARIFNVPQEAGLLVQRIAKGSPAEYLGLRGGSTRATISDVDILVGGDIILTVAGYEISGDGTDFNKIHARLSALRPGSQLIVKALRGGKIIELSAEVAKM